VGTAVSVLSTLAGARGGTVGATLRARRQENLGPDQSKNTVEEAITYLRVENPLFLFLGGSTDIVAATGVAAAAPPAISAACAGASTAHVSSLVGCLAAGAPAPAPGVISSTASAALGEGGEGSHLSGGARLPSLSSSSSPDDECSSVPGEESPCCSHSWNYSLLRSRRSRRRMLRSLLRTTRSCSRLCATRACARDRGVGGSDRAAFTALICKEQAKLQNH
jgi:hypothetical protein